MRVEAFRDGRLAFAEIVDTVAAVLLEAHDVPSAGRQLTVDDVLAADAWARDEAPALIAERRPPR